MKWIRRIHMYTGLALVPWVLVYAVSAFLFNHPGVMSATERTELGPDAFAGTAVAARPGPEAIAAAVVDALRARVVQQQAEKGDEDDATARKTDPSTYRLVDPTTAEWDRRLAWQVERDDGRHLLILGLDRGDGELRRSPPAEKNDEDRAPFRGRVKTMRPLAAVGGGLAAAATATEPKLLTTWKDEVPALFAELGVADVERDQIELRQAPSVDFTMEADGRRWLCSYDLGKGAVTAEPADHEGSITARSYLLNLHVAHGYPRKTGIRTVWAVFVDAMAILMIVWALSGILMWLQMPNVRLWGGVSLGAGVVTAGIVGYLMWKAFV